MIYVTMHISYECYIYYVNATSLNSFNSFNVNSFKEANIIISNTNQNELIQSLCQICHYPVQLITNGELIFSTSMNQQDIFYSQETPFLRNSALLNSFIDQKMQPAFLLLEDECIYYAANYYTENSMFIIGPLSFKRLDTKDIHAYVRKHKMQDYQNYHIPVASAAQAVSSLSLVHYILTNEYNNFSDVKDNTYTLQYNNSSDHVERISSKIDVTLQNYQLSNIDKEIQHIPYLIEEQLVSYIQAGNQEEIIKFLSNVPENSIGTMAFSSMKHSEYATVTGISLISRAAIKGGVSPYDAYDMSDLYLQKTSLCKSLSDYSKVLEMAIYGYISAVNKANAKKIQSLHIEKAKSYIAKHLNKHFTIDDLANYVGVSKSYLLHSFPKYEKQTLMEYIYFERIAAAKNMLTYSDYSISQIANYLCFGTQSHFGTIFKKITTLTPSEYRRNNHSIENTF